MKIGNYAIPRLRLFPTVYHDIKLIYENYRLETVEDPNTVAKLLGHKSANSGAWLRKLASLRSYGLLEPRSIKATPLAEKLTYGTEQEKQESTNQAVLHISLWKELYSKFGVELPESNFWVQLQKITGLDPVEAQKHADFVRNAYLDDISHIEAVEQSKTGEKSLTSGIIDRSTSTIDIQAGPFNQSIPLTKEGIELAKGFLDLLGKQLLPKEEKSEEEG